MIQVADVNALLRVMGYRPVNTISASQDADEAVATLEEVHLELITRSWWFNTELDFLLSINNDSEIELSDDVMHVAFKGTNRFIVRDNRIYDRQNNTYKMDEDILAASMVLNIPAEECPNTYRRYWLAEAKLRFCTFNNGEREKIQQLQTQLAVSSVACKQRDLDMRGTSALQSQYAMKLTAGMPPSSINQGFTEMYIGGSYDAS